MDKERLETRIKELQEAEGMAWANLHAIQGRLAECQYWLEVTNGAWTEQDLADAIQRGQEGDTDPDEDDTDKYNPLPVLPVVRESDIG